MNVIFVSVVEAHLRCFLQYCQENVIRVCNWRWSRARSSTCNVLKDCSCYNCLTTGAKSLYGSCNPASFWHYYWYNVIEHLEHESESKGNNALNQLCFLVVPRYKHAQWEMTLLISIKCCWSESFIKKNVWEGFLHSSLVLKFVAVTQSLLKGRKHERVLAELMELALFFVWFSRVVCKKLCNHMIITQIYFSYTQ